MSCKLTSFWALPSRSWSSLLLSMAQPLEMTMRPPPTCTTGREIPKKVRICEPIRKEAISRTKLFIATVRARILRAEAGYSRVKARKTGLPPRGLTMGNRALRMRSVLLATSSKGGLRRAEYSRDGFLGGHASNGLNRDVRLLFATFANTGGLGIPWKGGRRLLAGKKKKRGGVGRRVSRQVRADPESEEKADTDLDLPAGVGKVAVGVGDAAERRVEGQRGSGGRAADDVTGVVDAGYVLMIEEIEGFAQDFGAVTIAEANFFGKAEVHINGALHHEGIAADDVNALAAIGTVDA